MEKDNVENSSEFNDLTNKSIKIYPKFKIWLVNNEDSYILGDGGANLLKQINEHRDLGKAAEKLNISYRKAWNILKKIKKTLGVPVVNSFKGGKGGGGGMELTEFGLYLIKLYNDYYNSISNALKK